MDGLRRTLFFLNLSLPFSRLLPFSCFLFSQHTQLFQRNLRILSQLSILRKNMSPSPNPLFKFARDGFTVHVNNVADAGEYPRRSCDRV